MGGKLLQDFDALGESALAAFPDAVPRNHAAAGRDDVAVPGIGGDNDQVAGLIQRGVAAGEVDHMPVAVFGGKCAGVFGGAPDVDGVAAVGDRKRRIDPLDVEDRVFQRGQPVGAGRRIVVASR